MTFIVIILQYNLHADGLHVYKEEVWLVSKTHLHMYTVYMYLTLSRTIEVIKSVCVCVCVCV